MANRRKRRPIALTVLQRHGAFILVCIGFLIAGIVLSLTWFRYQLNTDGTAYIDIARHYAHFDIRDALNGYWSPLLSWLLVPWVWFHANLIIAEKITATICCLIILIVVYRFLLWRKVHVAIATLVTLILGPFLLAMLSIQAGTRDLLMTMLTTIFVLTLDRFQDSPRLRSGVWLGVLGALMFYAKGLGFYLFLALIALSAGWQWWKNGHEYRAVVRRYAPMVIIFFVLVTPFIGAISYKYHRLTINNEGHFGYAIISPKSRNAAYPVVAPMLPPNPQAMWYWEDPTDVIPLIPGYDWSLRHYPHYYFDNVLWTNLNSTAQIVFDMGPVVVFGLLLCVLYALRKNSYRQDYVIFAGVSVAMLLGYALILSDIRYLMVVGVLAFLGIGLWTQQMLKAKLLSMLQIFVAVTLIMTSTIMVLARQLSALKYDERPYYTVAQSLHGHLPEGSKIVSEELNSYYACYYLNLKCLGVLAIEGKPEDYYQSLKTAGVQYYIYFHSQDKNASLNKFTQDYFVPIYSTTVKTKTNVDLEQHVTIYRMK